MTLHFISVRRLRLKLQKIFLNLEVSANISRPSSSNDESPIKVTSMIVLYKTRLQVVDCHLHQLLSTICK